MSKGSQDDFNDAKIWLEPEIEVARPGRTLKRHALGQALKVILDTFALGKWAIDKTMRNFFNTALLLHPPILNFGKTKIGAIS